jgi:hypothetical protein
MPTHFRTPILLIFALVALPMGCDSCAKHTPPDTSGDTGDSSDANRVVTPIAIGLSASGAALQASAGEWGECVAGVVMQASGDYAIGVGVPIAEAIDGGATSGSVAGVTIDPSPCAGLPGEPTVEGKDIAREEIEAALAVGVPIAASLAAAGAAAAADKGDVDGCVVLTVLSDLLAPAGDLTMAITAIVENPGVPFESPTMSWDCSACLLE